MSPRARISVAGGILAIFYGSALLAGFLGPYDFSRQHRGYPYAPPTTVHFRDEAGRFHLNPFVYAIAADPLSGEYREDKSRIYPVRFLARAPDGRRFLGVDEPGILFLLGSDGFGRDIFSRLLYGGRVSLSTGLLAAIISVTLGMALGTFAGFFGGWPDRLLMRGGELVMALPWLYLLLAVRAFLPLHISTVQAFFLLIGIIGGVGWVRPARLIRGVVLSGKERGFVLAGRGFGAGPLYLIRKHILPQTLPVALTQATLLIPQYILAEVTLSFLGLGIGEPVPSWGNMLAEARQYHALVSHPWMLAPGLTIVPVLLAYIVLADALAEDSPA